MSGGGARAAYQVGLLRHIAREHPEFYPAIITGVSAGAVNAVHLASHRGDFQAAVNDLYGLWRDLRMGKCFSCRFLAYAQKLFALGHALSVGRYTLRT